MSDLLKECQDSMDKRIKAYEMDLSKVRTGRASITILDKVRVDYYGTPTPLNQVATLSTPDTKTIVVSPFEKSLISEIEKGIQKADLGLQPNNDGKVVRVPIPALTEDRRKDIVKTLKKNSEEVKVAIRMVRRDLNEKIKQQEKAKQIAEDESKRLQGEIQKLTDKYIKVVDEKTSVKEKEVMTL